VCRQIQLFFATVKKGKQLTFQVNLFIISSGKIMLTMVIRGAQDFPAAGCDEYFLYTDVSDHV